MKSSNISKKTDKKEVGEKGKFPFFKKGAADKKEEKCTCKTKCKDDKCKSKKAKDKKKSGKMDETIIMSYKQFINESDDFQEKYEPGQFVVDNDDEDSEDEKFHDDVDLEDANMGGGSDDFATEDSGMEEDTEDDLTEETPEEDDWNTGDDDTDMMEEEPTTVSPSRGMSSAEKTNNELMNINVEIGKLLDTYKADSDVQKYKREASPLLAKRKELQAKLDSVFNLGMEEDEEEMVEDPYRF